MINYVTGAIYFKVLKLFFYKKAKDKKFYIHDSGEYAQFFLNNFNSIFISIEDGTLNYNNQLLKKVLKKLIKK